MRKHNFGHIFSALFAFTFAPNIQALVENDPVNVMQDCWTTDSTQGEANEKELYRFADNQKMNFVWKHKILEGCISYSAIIKVYDCPLGKNQARENPATGTPILLSFFSSEPVFPDIPEPLLLSQTLSLIELGIPPGLYDWVVVTECNDTNGGVRAGDGDIEDQCGANFSTIKGDLPPGTIIFGPEPPGAPFPDRDPGGTPTGRQAGESGTTRPWCFEVCKHSVEICYGGMTAEASACCSGVIGTNGECCCSDSTPACGMSTTLDSECCSGIRNAPGGGCCTTPG